MPKTCLQMPSNPNLSQLTMDFKALYNKVTINVNHQITRTTLKH